MLKVVSLNIHQGKKIYNSRDLFVVKDIVDPYVGCRSSSCYQSSQITNYRKLSFQNISLQGVYILARNMDVLRTCLLFVVSTVFLFPPRKCSTGKYDTVRVSREQTSNHSVFYSMLEKEFSLKICVQRVNLKV